LLFASPNNLPNLRSWPPVPDTTICYTIYPTDQPSYWDIPKFLLAEVSPKLAALIASTGDTSNARSHFPVASTSIANFLDWLIAGALPAQVYEQIQRDEPLPIELEHQLLVLYHLVEPAQLHVPKLRHDIANFLLLRIELHKPPPSDAFILDAVSSLGENPELMKLLVLMVAGLMSPTTELWGLLPRWFTHRVFGLMRRSGIARGILGGIFLGFRADGMNMGRRWGRTGRWGVFGDGGVEEQVGWE
jgi:hypothetical protein